MKLLGMESCYHLLHSITIFLLLNVLTPVVSESFDWLVSNLNVRGMMSRGLECQYILSTLVCAFRS